jgi:hypothetical protein
VIALTANARCRSCDWTADGEWEGVDAQADRHTVKAQHTTYTMVTMKPATAVAR